RRNRLSGPSPPMSFWIRLRAPRVRCALTRRDTRHPATMDLAAAVAELKRSTDTFGPFIRTQAERFPDRVALKFEDETVSYGAYDRAVNRIAARLRREGVAAGTPVAILAPNSALFLAALGAVAKLRAIDAYLNTHVTGSGLSFVPFAYCPAI